MDEEEMRKFLEKFDNEQQTTMDAVDDLQISTLLEEISPWPASLETIASATTPTPVPEELQKPIYQPINVTNKQWSQDEFPISIPKPNSDELQNQLYPNINLYENVSVAESPQVTTSASVDIPNQINLITDDDRPPSVGNLLFSLSELLPSPVNEAYLADDVVEAPPDALGFLVGELIAMNRHQEAIKKCETTLSQMRLKKAMDNYPISQVLNILATVYIDLKNYDVALNILNNVLMMRQRKYGNEHLSVASVLNNMAVAHGRNRNYSEAYFLCKKSLDMKLKYLHTFHMEVAKQFDNLGTLDLFQNRYEAAAHYYLKALDIYKCRLGLNNPLTLGIEAKVIYCNGMIRYKWQNSE